MERCTASGCVLARGAFWANGASTGVFAAHLGHYDGGGWSYIGFRCAYSNAY